MKTIRETAELAMSRPMHVFATIIKGYRFMVHYDPSLGLLDAEMYFIPGWGHCRHIYGVTAKKLELQVNNEIEKQMKTFPNGGKFPGDYDID